jgi:hypothetical protein
MSEMLGLMNRHGYAADYLEDITKADASVQTDKDVELSRNNISPINHQILNTILDSENGIPSDLLFDTSNRTISHPRLTISAAFCNMHMEYT